MDRNLSPRNFDPSKEFVAATNMTMVGGIEVQRGDEVKLSPEGDKKGTISHGAAMRLWMTARLLYKEHYHPTPVEGDVDPATVIVDDAAVEAAAQALEAAKLPSVAVLALGGGFYSLTPSWGAPVEKVRGKAAVEAREAELLASAPKPAPAAPESTEGAPEGSDQTPAQVEPVEPPPATPEQHEAATNADLQAQLQSGASEVPPVAVTTPVAGSDPVPTA